jgi:hypothetical protein
MESGTKNLPLQQLPFQTTMVNLSSEHEWLSSELFLLTHAIIVPYPNLWLVAYSGDVILESDQFIGGIAMIPKEIWQAFIHEFPDKVAKAVLALRSGHAIVPGQVNTDAANDDPNQGRNILGHSSNNKLIASTLTMVSPNQVPTSSQGSNSHPSMEGRSRNGGRGSEVVNLCAPTHKTSITSRQQYVSL